MPEKKARFHTQNHTASSASKPQVKQAYELDAGGIRVILDSEEYHTKLSKSLLNKLVALRETLKTIDENDPKASIDISGVQSDVFHATMLFLQKKKLRLDCASKNEELTTLIKMVVFGVEMRAELGIFGAFGGSVILAKFKGILADENDPTTLSYEDVQLVYNKLYAGHPIRELCVEAAFRPWMEFHYDVHDDLDAPDSGSEVESQYRDAAHRREMKTNRPPYYKMLLGPHAIAEFRDDFFIYQQKAWHTRTVPTKKGIARKNGGIDYTRETTLVDALTDKIFIV